MSIHEKSRVKSGNFGHQVNSDKEPCLIHIIIIGIKIIINKANSENPDETAHKEPSHLDFHCLQMCVRIYLVPEVSWLYPTRQQLRRH